jgi:hypothetical protein
VSEKQYRDKIASIKKEQGKEETVRAKAQAAAAKHRAEAARQASKVTPRTSDSMARSYQRAAQSAESKAVAEDKKVATASTKLGRLASELASAEASLAREVKASARRVEQEDSKRRQTEKRHAQELGRLSPPTVIHEIREVPAPKPETLRVLYLTANPEMNLRVDVEVRQVQQAVRAALHRDQIEIVPRLAATPEDLLDGLNDVRPHVVHFSGHAGGAALVFDNASIETPEGRDVTFGLLARALAATATPPILLVLNGCDTLEGAEVLLNTTPVVIAMATEITDLAAATFAARFYAAIASAQPVQVALEQGALAVDFLDLSEGWKPSYLARKDVSLMELVLVKDLLA